MNERVIHSLLMEETGTRRLDAAVEILLAGLLLFMPLSMGVISAWSEEVVVAVSGVMALCVALKFLFHPESRVLWSTTAAAAALFTSLIALQLAPLPAEWVGRISPQTAELKTSLLKDISQSTGGGEPMTLSFYPEATRHGLRLILSAAAIFLAVVYVYRTPKQMERLLIVITAAGGLVALLALAQDVFGNGMIYWIIQANDGAHSGPFINHSHFGQFMNLSIGAALGLLLVKLSKQSIASDRGGQTSLIPGWRDTTGKTIWLTAGMMVVSIATLFISLTRGGMIAFLAAGALTTVVLAARRGMENRNWLITLLAMGSFVCVLYLGFDAVYERLATLRDLEQQASRWDVVRAMGAAWSQFLLFGTGLDTHEMVYPMFDDSVHRILLGHADMEYAQFTEETGLIGAILMILLVGGCWYAYGRTAIRNRTSRIRLPILWASLGLGMGLLAVMIQGLSDYGMRLPAIYGLTAAMGGMLIGLHRLANAQPETERTAQAVHGSEQIKRWGAGLVFLALVLVSWGWAVGSADKARQAERHWTNVLKMENRFAEQDWQATDEECTELLNEAEAAAAYQPENIQYQHWLNVYRWRAVSRATDSQTGELLMTDDSLAITRKIVEQLHSARLLCPTFGACCCVAGQLEYFVLNDPAGAEHIRLGYRLSPGDPTSCFVNALLDVNENQPDQAQNKFRRAVELDGSLYAEAAAIWIHQVNRPDLALELAGEDLSRLGVAVRLLGERENADALAEKTWQDMERLLQEKCSGKDAPPAAQAALAYVYLKQKNYASASEYLKQALAADYGNTNWRLTLARSLAQMGQTEQAIHEAKICLRLRPQMDAARQLIEELSTR